jgi:hypothetical protein
MAKRNYAEEYRRFHSRPEQIKRRAKRNAARRKMVKLGKVRKGSKMDVDHRKSGSLSNKLSDLRVVSRSKNRGFRRNSKGKNLGLPRGKKK